MDLPPGSVIVSDVGDARVCEGLGAPEGSVASLSLRSLVSPDFQAREESGRYPAVVLDLDWNSIHPLSVLGPACVVLNNQGKLFIRSGDADTFSIGDTVGPPSRRGYYLRAMAAHFGLEPDSPGVPGFFSFVKANSARWNITRPRPENLEDYRGLFLRSFAHEISADLWRWKYADNRGRAIVAERGGEAVAHYGGTARRIMFSGETASALQICDVMVNPAERAVMTKRGVFFQVASTFLEAYFGYEHEYLLAYGFPNYRHLRLAKKMGLYEETERITELRWTTAKGRIRMNTTARLLDLGIDHSELISMLWRHMRADLQDAIVVIRDPEYIKYRYLLRPERVYEFLLVRKRWSTRPIGLVVLYRDGQECKLMDMIGPLSAMPELVEHARQLAFAWGCNVLTAWVSEGQASRFEWGQVDKVSTDICVPANIWSEGPEPQQIRSRWWLMMGDTEFL
ncbi:MAG: GNAT family N-acetyltransferase [Methylococcus sp.]|nr:GNAT family N-acetyltransferase [Methylococcus sp.]